MFGSSLTWLLCLLCMISFRVSTTSKYWRSRTEGGATECSESLGKHIPGLTDRRCHVLRRILSTREIEKFLDRNKWRSTWRSSPVVLSPRSRSHLWNLSNKPYTSFEPRDKILSLFIEADEAFSDVVLAGILPFVLARLIDSRKV